MSTASAMISLMKVSVEFNKAKTHEATNMNTMHHTRIWWWHRSPFWEWVCGIIVHDIYKVVADGREVIQEE